MALNIKTTVETMAKLNGLLEKRQDFCYTRFGDTQLMLIDGWYGHGHEQVNSPKLRLLMTKALAVNDPDYLIAPSCGYELEPGMRPGTFALYRNDAELVRTVEKHATAKEFWHCEALHYAMIYDPSEVVRLFDAISKRDVLIVAGEQLDIRKVAFKNADIIRVPMDNAFRHWEAILNRIYEYDAQVVLFSCGPLAQILQYFMFLDRPFITTINMGSVFNALLGITEGIHTRAWIRQNEDRIKAFTRQL